MRIVGFSGGPIANPLLLPDGSAAAPALSFSADTNTGLYRISADLLGVVAGGDEVIRISATQTQLVRDGTVGAPALTFRDDGDTGLIRVGANSLALVSGGGEALIATGVASAVNEITVTNAATGNAPAIAATGGDTNIMLKLAGKGTGGVQMGATGGYVGFYGTTPVALQTGVAVSAAGIHAALVNLGLITA